MKPLMSTMLQRLSVADHDELIRWAAPVPCFGDLTSSGVATVGINPSNREFVDTDGLELSGLQRRFHTLSSLGIECWDDAQEEAIDGILELCSEYFFRNPYGAWFNRLTPIISAAGASYYDRLFPACHLDLLPFATDAKWGSLPPARRREILDSNADLLVDLIATSDLELLILNGQSVVSEFMLMTGLQLAAQEMPGWDLPRASGQPVAGIGYKGTCEALNGKALAKPLTVLGFNHNIQSSFGVTSEVIQNISKWVERESRTFEFKNSTKNKTLSAARRI